DHLVGERVELVKLVASIGLDEVGDLGVLADEQLLKERAHPGGPEQAPDGVSPGRRPRCWRGSRGVLGRHVGSTPGEDVGRRKLNPSGSLGRVSSSRRPARRSNSRRSAVAPWMRARLTPRHIWMPLPNDRFWRLSPRVMSKRSGSGKAAGSRFAAWMTGMT